jgi:hypothetical protein
VRRHRGPTGTRGARSGLWDAGPEGILGRERESPTMTDPFDALRAMRAEPATAGATPRQRKAIAEAETRSDGVGWGSRALATVLGSGLAGGIGSSMLVLLANVGKGPFAGILAGAAAGLAVEFTHQLIGSARAGTFDGPRYQALLEGLRERLDVGPVAARRASAWVVYDGSGADPRVMSDREYASFRAGAPQVNEIRISGDTVVVNRLRNGLLDSGHTAAPAIERIDIPSGRVLSEAWYVRGEPASREASHAAYEAYRILNPASPGQREVYGSSRINEADDRRRAEGALPDGGPGDDPGLPAYR